jgi:hypothetical protein
MGDFIFSCCFFFFFACNSRHVKCIHNLIMTRVMYPRDQICCFTVLLKVSPRSLPHDAAHDGV